VNNRTISTITPIAYQNKPVQKQQINSVIQFGLHQFTNFKFCKIRTFYSKPDVSSPSDYEITLEGSKNKRFQRLSRSAIMRLVRREGRLERRLMRMFDRGGRRPLKKIGNKNIHDGKVLWATNKRNKTKEVADENLTVLDVAPKKYQVLGAKKEVFPSKKIYNKNKKKVQI